MDRVKGTQSALLAALLLVVSGSAAAASGGEVYDSEAPTVDAPIEPFFYIDGVNQVAELTIGPGQAVYLDAANQTMTVETPVGPYELSMAEVVNSSTVSVPDQARAEIQYVFSGGGMSTASLGIAQRDYSTYHGTCLAVGCTSNQMDFDGVRWNTSTLAPKAPPPPPPPRREQPDIRDAQDCIDAAIETVDAGMAQHVAAETCKAVKSKGGAVVCAGSLLYASVRTTMAMIKGSRCTNPTPAPSPTPPRNSYYYGW